MLSSDTLLSLLQKAVTAERGIAIRFDDPWGLRQALFRAKYKQNNPAFEELAFKIPPTLKGELWIIKSNGNALTAESTETKTPAKVKNFPAQSANVSRMSLTDLGL